MARSPSSATADASAPSSICASSGLSPFFFGTNLSTAYRSGYFAWLCTIIPRRHARIAGYDARPRGLVFPVEDAFVGVLAEAQGISPRDLLTFQVSGPGVNEVIAEYGKSIGALLALIAAVTMTMGNLSALKQSSLKRMLAYSSIAHAGYVLIGAAAMTAAGFEAAMWYLAAYYFMNLGAFAVVLYFEAVTGSDKLENLKGLGPKYPLVSVAMVALLVSLTGLPPTVGFYGKYLLFVEGVDAGLMWLVVVAALNSVVSLFYYFRVAKALFLEQGEDAPTVLCLRQPRDRA